MKECEKVQTLKLFFFKKKTVLKLGDLQPSRTVSKETKTNDHPVILCFSRAARKQPSVKTAQRDILVWVCCPNYNPQRRA